MVNRYNPAHYYPQNLDLYGGQYQPALYPSVFPAFHVLSKANGGVVAVSWSVRNDGQTVGFANLVLVVGGQIAPTILGLAVNPGATVVLSQSITLAGQPTGVAVAGTLTMLEVTSEAGGSIRNIATHNFTVNIPAAGPLLVAVGDPTIT